MKRSYPEALVICLAAAALGLIVNGLRPDGLPLFPREAPRSIAVDPQNPRQIPIEEAIARFKQGDALFADARSPADYAAGHIAGAVNLPAQTPDAWMPRVFAEVPPDRTVITYCSGSRCILSEKLAEILAEAGFENVFHLEDGWTRWTERGLPTEKGDLID